MNHLLRTHSGLKHFTRNTVFIALTAFAVGTKEWASRPPALGAEESFRMQKMTEGAAAKDEVRSAANSRRADLPFSDTQDFEVAKRGLIAPLPEGMIKAADGTVVWNLNDYRFFDQKEPPETVNPSLWRQARLNTNNGLFRVVDRIYQVRGFDLSIITIVEGETRKAASIANAMSLV
jgi:alkyl sulfatase BDS1-like metallo-beta-lactamase superfamily hydrolase